MSEQAIVHETDNLYVYRVSPTKFEVRCHSRDYSYAVVVGLKNKLSDAIQTCERIEPYIDKYRTFAGI